jgi:uncharacterized membrane protein YjfL (UPF0719 family)
MLIESVSNFLLKSHALGLVVKFDQLAEVLVTTLIFVLIGLVVFGIAFFVVVKASPFSVRKEIEEDQNMALAVIIGAMIIGIALIISAAIQG